jgi:hypothetical protein
MITFKEAMYLKKITFLGYEKSHDYKKVDEFESKQRRFGENSGAFLAPIFFIFIVFYFLEKESCLFVLAILLIPVGICMILPRFINLEFASSPLLILFGIFLVFTLVIGFAFNVFFLW